MAVILDELKQLLVPPGSFAAAFCCCREHLGCSPYFSIARSNRPLPVGPISTCDRQQQSKYAGCWRLLWARCSTRLTRCTIRKSR
jgi:hypothetical protein